MIASAMIVIILSLGNFTLLWAKWERRLIGTLWLTLTPRQEKRFTLHFEQHDVYSMFSHLFIWGRATDALLHFDGTFNRCSVVQIRSGFYLKWFSNISTDRSLILLSSSCNRDFFESWLNFKTFVQGQLDISSTLAREAGVDAPIEQRQPFLEVTFIRFLRYLDSFSFRSTEF